MADILVGKQGKSLETSDKLQAFSRVIIRTGQQDSDGNDIVYTAGNTTGRTLEIDNPWGSQAIADNILAKIQGWAYQPMTAGSVKLPPAFELGDSVVVNDVYSGVYNAKVRFSSVFAGDVEAPLDKEIDHEYKFETSTERKYTRKFEDVITRLNFFSDSIQAKVDKQSNGSTFGWQLTDSAWTIFNQSGTLFKVDANGAYVKGEIQASSGKVGGFTIGANAIYNNISSYGGLQETGVYIGTNGIQLGNKFKVDANGNMTASSGTFTGTISAKNISYGGSNGTLSGSAITASSLGLSQLTSGINTSLGYADFSNQVFNNRSRVKYMDCQYLYSTVAANLKELIIDSARLTYDNKAVVWKSVEVVTGVSISQGDYKGIVQMTNGSYYTCRGNPSASVSTGMIYYLGR